MAQLALFVTGFCPNGWLPADGRTLSVQENQALAYLLGKTYGGNGTTTFALPKLPPPIPDNLSKDIDRQLVESGRGGPGSPIWCISLWGRFPARD